MAVAPQPTVKHVVVMVQENHTTDNYFRGMAAYGANVVANWPIAVNPPTGDQAHDRHAYWRWLTHQITGAHVQFDTNAVLPFYAYLAATGPSWRITAPDSGRTRRQITCCLSAASRRHCATHPGHSPRLSGTCRP